MELHRLPDKINRGNAHPLSGSNFMYYLIYKTINLINGKYYIGKHQTQDMDDGYQGSGRTLGRAIKKYGRPNFVTHIIGNYETEKQMNLAEKILVVPDIETNYNLCPGGQGGFGYINNLPNQVWRKEACIKGGKIGGLLSPTKFSKGNKAPLKHLLGNTYWVGRTHSTETKEKMRQSHNPRSHPVGVKRGPYKRSLSPWPY